jgi:hypothetical protein
MADFAIRFGMVMPHANFNGCCSEEFVNVDCAMVIIPKIVCSVGAE